GDVADLPPDAGWPDPFVEQVEALRVGLQVRLVRADLLMREGRGPEAVALLREVVADRPDADQAWLLLGQTLLRLNRPAEAEEALRQLLRLAPESVEGWFLLGVARHGLGQR